MKKDYRLPSLNDARKRNKEVSEKLDFFLDPAYIGLGDGKKFYIITLTLAMAFAPLTIMAEPASDGIEMSVSGISLSIKDGNVHIVGANGEVMEIFNLTGAKVATVRIDSNDKTFALNLQKGCYLIKVGKIVRKISIQ